MAVGEQALGKYPHLLKGEVRHWRAFLRLYEREYDRFEYDVHVGAGSLPQEAQPGVYAKDFQHLTKKRIDVVGWKDGHATIFEVRERASLPLMGQLLGYRALWMRSNPTSEPPAMVMVCSICPPDDLAVMNDNDITVVRVHPDEKA